MIRQCQCGRSIANAAEHQLFTDDQVQHDVVIYYHVHLIQYHSPHPKPDSGVIYNERNYYRLHHFTKKIIQGN